MCKEYPNLIKVGPILRKNEESGESKDSQVVAPEEKTGPKGLYDWKVTAPIGIAIAIPVFSNGVS